MVSEDELLKVLKTTLQERGEYGKLKAELQTQLIQALELNPQLADPDKPTPPLSVTLVNELVREYLAWSQYKFSEKIFSTEASLPSASMSRDELCQQLNVKESPTTSQLPLLFTVLSTITENKPKRN